jgi:hypothetical protein
MLQYADKHEDPRQLSADDGQTGGISHFLPWMLIVASTASRRLELLDGHALASSAPVLTAADLLADLGYLYQRDASVNRPLF